MIAERSRLFAVLGVMRGMSRERSAGPRTKFGKHLLLGEEEVELLKEGVKEWPCTPLWNLRFPRSVSSHWGSGTLISGGVRGQQAFKRVMLRGQVNRGKLRGVDVYSGTWRARPAPGCQSRQPGLPAPGGFHHPKWVRTFLLACPPPHAPLSFLFSPSPPSLALPLLPLTLTPSPICSLPTSLPP